MSPRRAAHTTAWIACATPRWSHRVRRRCSAMPPTAATTKHYGRWPGCGRGWRPTPPLYLAVLDELIPSAWQHVEQHINNPIEAYHRQLKTRLRPMRGQRTVEQRR
jgi:hypothetical protein